MPTSGSSTSAITFPAKPRTTCPEILAAIIIANHPTQYGFDEITLDPPVLTDTVTINYSADLRLVSDIVGAPVDELIALNPSLLRMVTPPETEFDLHLPAGTASLFQEKIAAIPESKRNSWRYHKSRRTTPWPRLRTPTASLSPPSPTPINSDQPRKLEGVEALVVPVRPRPPHRAHTVFYTTRRGDTLVSVADRFGVSLDQLRRWNKLPLPASRSTGRRLHVAEPTVVRAGSSRSRHGRGRTNTSREVASAASPSHESSSGAGSSRSKTSSSRSSRTTHTGGSTSSKGAHSAASAKHPSHSKSSAHAKK